MADILDFELPADSGNDLSQGFSAIVANSDNSGSVQDLVNAQSAQLGALQNVSVATAVGSKITGIFGQGAVLPIAIMGLGVVAIALIPQNGSRRR